MRQLKKQEMRKKKIDKDKLQDLQPKIAPVTLNDVLSQIGKEQLTLRPQESGCTLGEKVSILTE